MLAEKISSKSEEFRIGIDGMISGYLLLTGNTGLDNIDDWKFKIHDGKKAAFSETYAAMMGLRFMWQYAGGTHSPTSGCSSRCGFCWTGRSWPTW